MTKTGILQPAKPEAPIFDIATSHVSRRWGPATASISTMLRSGRLNQTGFTGGHKAWKISHDQRKFRKPFFDGSAGARSAFGA